MQAMIQLKNEKRVSITSEKDFALLLYQEVGEDASDYFEDILDSYDERVSDLEAEIEELKTVIDYDVKDHIAAKELISKTMDILEDLMDHADIPDEVMKNLDQAWDKL
jgi:hypothetical protein